MVDKIQGLNLTNESNVQRSAHPVKNVQSINVIEGTKRSGNDSNSSHDVRVKKAFEDLAKKLEDLKKVVKTSFKYEILKNPDMIVLKIVNDDNGEVIRQIPPKEAVRLAKAIDELLGLFVDKHV